MAHFPMTFPFWFVEVSTPLEENIIVSVMRLRNIVAANTDRVNIVIADQKITRVQ